MVAEPPIRLGAAKIDKPRIVSRFPWDRSELFALAMSACSSCEGTGAAPYGDTGAIRYPYRPCKCVLRAIFRTCYRQYRDCVSRDKFLSKVAIASCSSHKIGKATCIRPNEDYIADFELVSRRALDELHYQVFRLHFLRGGEWKACCTELNIDRGTFFHAVYHVEESLGRRFRELKPYGLFPLDGYFGSRAMQKASSADNHL